MTDGVLTLQHPDGSRTEGPIKMGQSYYRDAGVEHDVINLTDREIVFVEAIPKTPSGKVRKPLLRDAYLDGRARS